MRVRGSDIEGAIAALHEGRVIGLPTDTVYGLAVDPMNPDALGALVELKGRDEGKPIPILVADVHQARGLGMVDEADVLGHWPGALTVVVARQPATPTWLGDPDAGTIGLRVPDHPVALELLGAFGALAVTSCNRSGEPPVGDVDAARELFGESVAVYLEGAVGGAPPSTVVDLTVRPGRVLREGPVAWSGRE